MDSLNPVMATRLAMPFAAFRSVPLKEQRSHSENGRSPHEFQSVDGVVEDITDIVLNLKKVLVISHKADPVTLTLEVESEGEVTAADIAPAEGIEIINPEQLILTTDSKQKISAEMVVTIGRVLPQRIVNLMTSL